MRMCTLVRTMFVSGFFARINLLQLNVLDSFAEDSHVKHGLNSGQWPRDVMTTNPCLCSAFLIPVVGRDVVSQKFILHELNSTELLWY